jgi:hypothetical protein
LPDLRFSQQRLWRELSSGTLCHVIQQKFITFWQNKLPPAQHVTCFLLVTLQPQRWRYMILQNVYELPLDYMVSHPRRQYYSLYSSK